MPAYRDPWEERLLADPWALPAIAAEIGGPFHLVNPDRVRSNIRAFQDVFVQHRLDGAIYYGKKANKARCAVHACAETGAGVDVSSGGELEAALAGGVRGADLVITGPAKSTELLRQAAAHNALIAIDDPEELERLSATGVSARILLRVLPPGSASRFGMTDDELRKALTLLAGTRIRLQGYSFHLTGYEIADRAELATALIGRVLEARRLGHAADIISIGGGFGVDYVPEQAWHTFLEEVNPLWFHGDRGFDASTCYPYHFSTPGPAMLAAVLRHGGLGKRLRDHHIRLAIEPGRALLDRAGSTVFTVQGVKTRDVGGTAYDIVTVNGSSLSLSEQWFDSEYLPDPVLWPRRPAAEGDEVTPTCVGGATCLDDDMLSRRRIPLPRAAKIGDLLIYPNTAGYQMDSNESRFHELPIPPKIILRVAENGRQFLWEPDAIAPRI
ncbi:alanine racemase [Nocardia sp. NPDC088792]|uniref:alanine racemase n=1 Tax=Nocardia sp. NPDC088792 TaxID=3364332 RepID=UPI00382C4628